MVCFATIKNYIVSLKGRFMCESCKKGYNGRNGMGYQPCGCKPTEPAIEVPTNKASYILKPTEITIAFLIVLIAILISVCI